jgi:hypothetical protein
MHNIDAGGCNKDYLRRNSWNMPYKCSFWLCLLLVTTSPAKAILMEAAAVAEILGAAVGIGTTVYSLVAPNVGDDHPLYSVGSASPSLTVTADLFNFDLKLQQLNVVGEFEDDLPVKLSDTAKFMLGAVGSTEVWKWDLTVRAEINTLFDGPSSLLVGGSVQHVANPHPELGETSGVALQYTLTVTIASPNADDPTQQLHISGPHFYFLNPARLESTWTGGIINNFSVHLHAMHPQAGVPSGEDSLTLCLFAAGFIGFLRYVTRQKEMR